MATYVMSDIHGEYDQLIELLNKIELKDNDILYVLGDMVDRGPNPIKVVKKFMEMPNVIPIVGNHEYMALCCLDFLCKEITKESIASLTDEMIDDLLCWQQNGSGTTIDEFVALPLDEKKDIIDYLKDFSLYEKVNVRGQKYLLVHGGLGNFSKDKAIEDYELFDLIWERSDYGFKYFDDVIIITGHTPTCNIEENPNPNYIYKGFGQIAIDCGACFEGGRLACICLDTGEEFYSSGNIIQ